MNVLLSAYACEPKKGSEPEVGWRVAIEMARHCEVRVLTRANNRNAIEAELAQYVGPKPDFIYYDLPQFWLWLKKVSLGTAGYYILWQAAVRWKFRNQVKEVDLIHHVTFNGFQLPGLWIFTNRPVVLGPLGGGMSCPATFLEILNPGRRRERIRSLFIRCVPLLPWWRATISNAALVLAANRETATLLQPHCQHEVPVMLETAFSEDLVTSKPHKGSNGSKFRILWLGNLIPRKAPILAVRALHCALKIDPNIELVIAGAGPEESRLIQEAQTLGVESQITMLGRVPKPEVERLMDEADAFIFTSVRDTSGNVVLEAMSRGLPVITLWHQGVREICDADCALVIPPSDVETAIRELADAIIRLRSEGGLAQQLGEAGIRRIKDHLTWKDYGERMSAIYDEVLGLQRD